MWTGIGVQQGAERRNGESTVDNERASALRKPFLSSQNAPWCKTHTHQQTSSRDTNRCRVKRISDGLRLALGGKDWEAAFD